MEVDLRERGMRVSAFDVRLDEQGRIAQFRTRLSLSFKYEG